MLGDKLKALRKDSGLSQDYIAEKLYTSRSTVQRWECNKSVPTSGDLIKLAEMLNVDVDYLLNDDNPKITDEKQKGEIHNENEIVKQLVKINYILSEKEATSRKLFRIVVLVILSIIFIYFALKLINAIII